ncbi:MAG: hypothetical protein R2712_09270 [Vicinamibacterales bacterium]
MSEVNASLDGLTEDSVDFLRFADGQRFSLYSSDHADSDPFLTGLVAPPLPASIQSNYISGTFAWKDGQLVEADIHSVRLSLRAVTIRDRDGVGVAIPPSVVVNLSSRGPLTLLGGMARGTIEFLSPRMSLDAATLAWGSDIRKWSLSGRSVLSRISLPDGAFAVENGTFSATPLRRESGAERIDLFPDHTIGDSTVSFNRVVVTLTNLSATIRAAEISVADPSQVEFEPWRGTAVDAVAKLSATNVESRTTRSSHASLVFPRPIAARVTITPNIASIVDRLNIYSGAIPSETLVPTGLSTTPYSTISALSAFHRLTTSAARALGDRRTSLAAGTGAGATMSKKLVSADQLRRLELHLENKVFAQVHLDGKVFTGLCAPSKPDCVDEEAQRMAEATISLVMPATPIGKEVGALVRHLLQPVARNIAKTTPNPLIGTVTHWVIDAAPEVAEQAHDGMLE